MLEPYRVLDLSDERGLFCSRILSELGADVIHVEPPGGSPARHRGHFAGGTSDPERSLTWWAMARGDRSIVLDLDDADQRRTFFDLVASADILVESADPGRWEARGLGYDELAAVNPRLVWVSMTPFGADGPKAAYAATDLIVQAASGAMALTGEAGRPPLRAAAVPAWTHAAAEAAGGALIALWEAQRSGRGQKVEVSAQRATNLTAQFMQSAEVVGHNPIVRAGGFTLQGIDFPFIWPVADGYVSLTLALDPVNKPFLDRLMAFMVAEGHGAEGITDRDWTVHLRLIRSGDAPREDLIALREAVGAFLATRTKAELFERGAGSQVAAGAGVDVRRPLRQPPAGPPGVLDGRGAARRVAGPAGRPPHPLHPPPQPAPLPRPLDRPAHRRDPVGAALGRPADAHGAGRRHQPRRRRS